MDTSKTESGLPDLLCGPIAAVEKVKMNAPSELNIATMMAQYGSETTRSPCHTPARPNAQAPMNSCEDEASVSFRTVLGRISNSAVLSGRGANLLISPSIQVEVIAERARLRSGAVWQLPKILIGRSWLHSPRKQTQQIMYSL